MLLKASKRTYTDYKEISHTEKSTKKSSLSQSILKHFNEIRTENHAKYIEFKTTRNVKQKNKMTNMSPVEKTSKNCDNSPDEWPIGIFALLRFDTCGNRREITFPKETCKD